MGISEGLDIKLHSRYNILEYFILSSMKEVAIENVEIHAGIAYTKLNSYHTENQTKENKRKKFFCKRKCKR